MLFWISVLVVLVLIFIMINCFKRTDNQNFAEVNNVEQGKVEYQKDFSENNKTENEISSEITEKSDSNITANKKVKGKNLIAIAAGLIIIIAVIVIVISGSGKGKLEGSWYNEDYGSMTLASDGTYFEDGIVDGTWEASSDELIIYYGTGSICLYSFDFDGDMLILKDEDDGWIFNKVG